PGQNPPSAFWAGASGGIITATRATLANMDPDRIPSAPPDTFASPHPVTLMQLRFASFVVINLRWDFHPQECARAGRTRKNARQKAGVAYAPHRDWLT
ncbi:MAG: hypothetical protein M1449_12260, partial [Candidatus Thermoplasmatota archaeon]|nr:hypothetical protein [Candidatus Thermoplasmatota archaeon]